MEHMKTFPDRAQMKLSNYADRRQQLRKTFWTILQQSLQVTLNFIDRQFVLNLFDDQLLLRRVDPVLD